MANQVKLGALVLLAGLILLTGCKMGSTMSSTGVPAKYLETFFKGEGAELYFVKPFGWKPESGKESMTLDITMDYAKDSLQKPLITNFSFLSEKAAPKIEKVTLGLDSGEKEFSEVDQIYVEKDPRHKKTYRNRHTFLLGYEDFKSLVATESPTFSITVQGMTYTFGNPKKWDKRRVFLQDYMVDMIELNQ